MLTKSFWVAGFECSCHRRPDGKRLDLIESTRHDRFAAADYARLRRAGIRTARDGTRWHRIERSPGHYDFSSLLPMVRAARDAGVQVIWDLCHYGWPEDLDIFRPEFVDRFEDYARAVARLVADETDEPPFYCPVNEISFWSWAGGDVAYLNPCATGRGFELKAQLARASLRAIEAIRSVDRRARFLHAEPAIQVFPGRPEDAAAAEAARVAQFQAWEMLEGRLWPQLGGDESALDVLGVNYYPYNQWILHGPSVPRDDPRHRPFRDILREIWERFGRPMMIAETGAQGADRAPWIRHVAEEVRAARQQGIPVEGICLYPILDYPGWDDDRCCETGLWGFADDAGERAVCSPLLREIEQLNQEILRPEDPATRTPSPAPVHAGAPVDEETEHGAF